MINYLKFPALSNANDDGLLAMGGELTVDSLVSAYAQGIFPWYNTGQPILWWSPDPRLVLYPERMRITKSLRKTARQQRYLITCNQDFAATVAGCAARGREQAKAEPEATWITDEMKLAYVELHQQGYAHSIEIWQDAALVGGLYGVALGKVFFGESMFSAVSDASKLALWALCSWLQQHSYTIIDCQVTNEHLLSLGAEEIPRINFMSYLDEIDINQPQTEFAAGFNLHIDKFFNS